MMQTSAPAAIHLSASAVLHIARRSVGGNVRQNAEPATVAERLGPATGDAADPAGETVTQTIPTRGRHLRARREPLLGAVSGKRLTHPGPAGSQRSNFTPSATDVTSSAASRTVIEGALFACPCRAPWRSDHDGAVGLRKMPVRGFVLGMSSKRVLS